MGPSLSPVHPAPCCGTKGTKGPELEFILLPPASADKSATATSPLTSTAMQNQLPGHATAMQAQLPEYPAAVQARLPVHPSTVQAQFPGHLVAVQAQLPAHLNLQSVLLSMAPQLVIGQSRDPADMRAQSPGYLAAMQAQLPAHFNLQAVLYPMAPQLIVDQNRYLADMWAQFSGHPTAIQAQLPGHPAAMQAQLSAHLNLQAGSLPVTHQLIKGQSRDPADADMWAQSPGHLAAMQALNLQAVLHPMAPQLITDQNRYRTDMWAQLPGGLMAVQAQLPAHLNMPAALLPVAPQLIAIHPSIFLFFPQSLKKPIIPKEFGGKVPTVIRQRYLNLFIEECLKFCSSSQEAIEKVCVLGGWWTGGC